jgi:hypothetical protein
MQADIILFTDDDVVVPPEVWVEQMLQVFLQSEADAVLGRLVLAPDLVRPWLAPQQKRWLAATSDQSDEPPEFGANMGFRRAVLERVPGSTRWHM